MQGKDRFAHAKHILEDPHGGYNIGTYMERSKHRLLKYFYEPDIAFHEVPFQGYIADILNDDGITEIQTVGFRALHDKLAVFLPHLPVTVVYPVSQKRRICWTDPESGEMSFGRYTVYPKSIYHLLSELLAIVDFFGVPGLSVNIVTMIVSEYRALDGYGPDRKKKATKLDTVPEELIDITVIRDASDIRKLLPFSSGQEITNEELSKLLGLRRIPLWRATKFLLITEIIVPIGKKGNSIIYKVTNEEDL